MSEDYELAVKKMLLREIRFTYPEEYIEVFHRKKYLGKRSGQLHEIDLSCEVSWLGTLIIIAVECKAYRRPVGIEDMLEFAQRLDDISVHKGLFFTTTGYTSGARKIAEAHRIALFVARAYVPQPSDSEAKESGLGILVARNTGVIPSARSPNKWILMNGLHIVPGHGCVYLKPTQLDPRGPAFLDQDIHETLEEENGEIWHGVIFREIPYSPGNEAELLVEVPI